MTEPRELAERTRRIKLNPAARIEPRGQVGVAQGDLHHRQASEQQDHGREGAGLYSTVDANQADISARPPSSSMNAWSSHGL